MKRNVFLVGMVFLMVATSFIFSSCNSCSDKRVKNLTDVPGVYKGEATLLLPESLKKMINKPDSTGKLPIPDGPIPCKIEIKKNAQDELVMELIDFTMPMKGVVLEPALCQVSQDGTIFSLEGSGQVAFGQRKLSYVHEGKIQDKNLELLGTISIIPKLLEVKISFKGEKI